MKDRKHAPKTDSDETETVTNIALFESERADVTALSDVIHQDDDQRAAIALERVEEELRQLHARWESVEDEIQDRDREMTVLRREVDDAKTRNATLSDLKQQLEEELHERRESTASATTRLTELESQNIELRVHLRELQDYIDGRKAEWDRMHQKLRDYEDTIRGVDDQLQRHDAIVATKEDEKAALASKVMELERELAELTGRYNERDSQSASMQQSLDDKAQEVAEANKMVLQLQQQVETLEGDLDTAQQDATAAGIDDSAQLVELQRVKDDLEAANIKAAENEIRAVELQAVLLESETDQRKLEAELDAQRELVLVLEEEVASKQREIEKTGSRSANLAAVPADVREIDFQIDADWTEEPAALHEDSEAIFEPVDDDVMLLPDEIFNDPADLAQHVIVADDGSDGAERFALTAAEMTIGRSRKADIRLKSKYISRRHARLLIDDDGVVIEDLGSMNGFSINSEPSKWHRLAHGDRLQIGESRFQYIDSSMG